MTLSIQTPANDLVTTELSNSFKTNRIIGFTTQFYTLWSVSEIKHYVTDNYGKHWLSGITTKYHYMKNISKDIDKVLELYPNVEIDESIRGEHNWFERKSANMTPHILQFGKYTGFDITELVKTDLKYVVWVTENCNDNKVVHFCKNLPEIIEYYVQKESEKAQKQAQIELKKKSWVEISSGEIELNFTTNVSTPGHESDFIRENLMVMTDIPQTLVWETVEKQRNWMKIVSIAKTEFSHEPYEIIEHPGPKYSRVNYEPKNTIEEVKEQFEIQELSNKGILGKYMTPTKFKKYEDYYFGSANTGQEGQHLMVFFKDIKYVNSLYPYGMPIINGKPMKVKGKTVKLNVTVFHTERHEWGIKQWLEVQ